jgi:hypothetical protein
MLEATARRYRPVLTARLNSLPVLGRARLVHPRVRPAGGDRDGGVVGAGGSGGIAAWSRPRPAPASDPEPAGTRNRPRGGRASPPVPGGPPVQAFVIAPCSGREPVSPSPPLVACPGRLTVLEDGFVGGTHKSVLRFCFEACTLRGIGLLGAGRGARSTPHGTIGRGCFRPAGRHRRGSRPMAACSPPLRPPPGGGCLQGGHRTHAPSGLTPGPRDTSAQSCVAQTTARG